MRSEFRAKVVLDEAAKGNLSLDETAGRVKS
jgi:hypothetical protein